MKIERPDLYELPAGEREGFNDILNRWFNTHVEPINKMLDDAVEVYTHLNRDDRPEDGYIYYTTKSEPQDTHKALLINIQPIKEETAEEVLRTLIKVVDIYNDEMDNGGGSTPGLMNEHINKAKKFLRKNDFKNE